MKLELFNMDEMIKLNKIPEVTDPVVFNRGAIPSTNGPLSREIFGVSIEDRSTIFGYVDLHVHVLNPFIYKQLKRMDRRIISIVHGNRTFSVQDGQLVDDPMGETGTEFLYKIWNKLDWKKNESYMRGERIDALESHKRDEIFLSKYLLIPPFYRDVNTNMSNKGRISHNELTDMYAKLIRYAIIVQSGNNFEFVINSNIALMQELLVEIYDHIQNKINKKNGLIRKQLLGKSTTYGSRLVISAPSYNTETPEEMTVNFKTAGLPLAYCCSNFTPFIIKWIKDFFRRELVTTGAKYMARTPDGEIIPVELEDPELYFTTEFIEHQIEHFIDSPRDRFNPIQLPTVDKSIKLYFTFVGRVYTADNTGSTISRYATWTDIFYRAAYDVTSDKHIYITRFPITDYFGTYPNRIHVMSTNKTFPVIINDTVYKHYPVIDSDASKDEIAVSFIDTLRMSNHYLKGLNGDYDGDQTSVKGLFTQEANLESEKIINSPANIFTINGENMRSIGNEGVQTLYAFTKFKE